MSLSRISILSSRSDARTSSECVAMVGSSDCGVHAKGAGRNPGTRPDGVRSARALTANEGRKTYVRSPRKVRCIMINFNRV